MKTYKLFFIHMLHIKLTFVTSDGIFDWLIMLLHNGKTQSWHQQK